MMRCEARGFRFYVHGDVEHTDALLPLFAPLERAGGSAETIFAVARPSGDATQWHVAADGQLLMACSQRGEALHGLIVHITQRVVRARDDLLSVHAASVATAAGAAVLPGSSGSGKTTLCARLLQLGAAYLSDDSVAIDDRGRIIGYPKPLGFKAGTRDHFADSGLGDLNVDHGTQLVWQVPPSRLGATSVTAAEPVSIFVPRFEAGAPLTVERISRPSTAAALLGQVQNLQVFGVSDALEVIGRLVARIPGHSVVYGDAREAAPAVLDLMENPSDIGSYLVVPSEPAAATVTQPFPAPDLSALCFEDGGLLARASGEFITVDRTAALIWPLLDGHRTVESIGTELAPLFDAPRSEVQSGIFHWIGELVDRGFLLTPSK